MIRIRIVNDALPGVADLGFSTARRYRDYSSTARRYRDYSFTAPVRPDT
jgi:hypothetical protein